MAFFVGVDWKFIETFNDITVTRSFNVHVNRNANSDNYTDWKKGRKQQKSEKNPI